MNKTNSIQPSDFILPPSPVHSTGDARLAIIRDLAFLGHTNVQIAKAIGLHPATLTKVSHYRELLSQVRAERAAAVAQLWRQHPETALRPESRADQLVELVRRAEVRGVRRPAMAPV